MKRWSCDRPATFDVIWRNMMWRDVTWRGKTWHGVTWHDVTCNGQRAPRSLSALSDWWTTGSSPRGRQDGTATTVPIIPVGGHASAVALVRRGGPGELKIGLLVYKCLHGLAPGYLSDQCILASTFAGRANMRSSTSLDRLLYVPQTKTTTLGPRGFY